MSTEKNTKSRFNLSQVSIYLFLLILYSSSSICGFELNRNLNTTNDNEKNGYEAVNHVIEKRDLLLEIDAFKQKYSKYLEEKKHSLFGRKTPLFIARTRISGIDNKTSIVYDKIHYPTPGNKVMAYHDHEKKNATITNFGEPCIKNGTGGCHDIRLTSSIKNLRRFTGSNHHVSAIRRNMSSTFYKIDKSPEDHPPNFLSNTNMSEVTMYPEILVVVDYETYLAHGLNYASLAAYMAAFWNAVDLRFREINSPKIRLNIAGLVVTTEPGAEPYMTRDSEYFSNNTLHRMAHYYYDTFPHEYDIIVAITHRSLKKIQSQEQAGIAFVGKACQGTQSAAVVRDFGGFEGIVHAAHELGHLFGAIHDGEIAKGIPGGNCTWNDGYMMGCLRGSNNRMHWSNCSIEAMQKYLGSSVAKCLRNRPDIGEPNFKKLPGKLLSRDLQCDQMFPGHTSFDDTNCDKLSCRVCMLWSYFCYDALSYRIPPAEGTSCGDGMFCLNGKCIKDPGIFD